MFDVQLQQEENLENRSTSISQTVIVPMNQNTIDNVQVSVDNNPKQHQSDHANPPSTLSGTILSDSMQKVRLKFIFQYFIYPLNYIIHL